jgi:hypothetical protein
MREIHKNIAADLTLKIGAFIRLDLGVRTPR